MDVISKDRLKQILDMQQTKLEAMQAAGESKDRIDNMKFAIKCTMRRLERAEASDYEESVRNIQQIGKEE